MEMIWWLGVMVGVLGAAVVAWAIFVRGRARGRLRCSKCWYDMSGAVAERTPGKSREGAGEEGTKVEGRRRCPECGRVVTRDKQLLKTRRHWRLAFFGLFVMAAGAGTSAWPMLAAKQWQRYTPSTVLVFFADAGLPTGTDETWKELAVRAKYDQLALWQRGMLAGRLGEGLATLPMATADEHVELICLLRPPPSEELAVELVAYGRPIEHAQDERAERDAELLKDYPEGWRSISFTHGRTLHYRRKRVNEAISYAGTDIGRDELIRLLGRDDRSLWGEGVAVGLARIGDEHAIAALCEYLESNPLYDSAYDALAAIGPQALVRAEPVMQRLVEGNASRQQWTERCLAVMRGEVKDITITIARETLDNVPTEVPIFWQPVEFLFTDSQAYFELGSPSHPERAVPTIVGYLDSEIANVRSGACMLLEHIGPNARPAIPALKALLNDPDVGLNAQQAIDAIRRPD